MSQQEQLYWVLGIAAYFLSAAFVFYYAKKKGMQGCSVYGVFVLALMLSPPIGFLVAWFFSRPLGGKLSD